MKNYTAIVAFALALPAGFAIAQSPENRPPTPPPTAPNAQPDRPPGGPDRREHPPVPPIIAALDKNHDGVISEDEIAGAADALRTLDKNHDGKLQIDELMPPPRPPMRDGAGLPVPPPGLPDGPRPDAPMRARSEHSAGGRDGAPPAHPMRRDRPMAAPGEAREIEMREHVFISRIREALRDLEGPHARSERPPEPRREGFAPPPMPPGDRSGPPVGVPRPDGLRERDRAPHDAVPHPEGRGPRDGAPPQPTAPPRGDAPHPQGEGNPKP